MDEERFLQFHQIASARKMDLAMRGLPCERMVDEMYEQANGRGLEPDGWEAFVLEQLPSPRDNAVASKPVRPLQRFMQLLLESLLGDDDVDIKRFVSACRAFIAIISKCGTFAAVSVREAVINLEKIEAAQSNLASLGPAAISLDALFKHEVASGMHGAGGVLKDASGAMGVLWMCRVLTFWEQVCLLRTVPKPMDNTQEDSLSTTLKQAYDHALLPHHGWVTQKAFEVAIATAPNDWPTMESRFAPSREEFRSDVHDWIRASQQILTRIMAKLRAHDLEDVRKSG